MKNTKTIEEYLVRVEYQKNFSSKKEEINYLEKHFKFRGVNENHPQILRFESTKHIYFDLQTATLYSLSFSKNDKVKIKEKVQLTNENFFYNENVNGYIRINTEENNSLVVKYADQLELILDEYIEIENNLSNLLTQMLQFGEVKNMMKIKPFHYFKYVNNIQYLSVGNTLSDHIEIEYYFNHFENLLIAYIESIPDMNTEERRVRKFVHVCKSVDEIEELGNKYLEEFYK